MSDIVFKLVSDASGFTGGFAAADAAVTKLNKGIADAEQASKEAADVAVNGGKKQGDEIDKVTKKTLSLKAQLKLLKVDLANATDPEDIERLARAAGALEDQIGDAADAARVFATDSPFEAVGNAIGSVGSKLRNLDFKGAADQSKLLLAASKQITFKESLSGMKDLGTTLLNTGKALLMNPIFLVGAAVALIIANFDELKNSGGVIGGFFQGISGAVQGLTDGLAKLTDYIGLTDIAFQKLQQNRLEKLGVLLEDGTKKFDRYLSVQKAYGKETTDIEKKKQDFIIQNSFLQLATLEKLIKANGKATDEQKKQIKDLTNAANDAATQKLVIDAEAQKKAADDREKANEKIRQNQEAFRQALIDLEKRAQQKELEGLSGVARLDMQRKLANEEIKLLEDTLIKKSIAAGKGNKLGVEQEKQLANLKTAVIVEYNKGVLALAIAEANKEAEIQKNKAATELQFLELRNTITKNGVEKIKVAEGSSALEKEIFENEKNKSLLQLELKFQEDKLKLVIAQIQAEANAKKTALQGELIGLGTDSSPAAEARKKQIANEIQSIEQGAVLTSQAASSAFEKVKSDIDTQITGIDGVLKKLSGKIDWQTALGLSDEDVAAIKSNFPVLLSEAQKFMTAYLDFQDKSLEKEISANEKRQSLLDKDIEGLQTKLDAELAAQSEGLANRVESIKREMDEKKKAKEKELEDEKKLKVEQQKLAKERLQLQQIQQAASLTTAIANIFASTSTAGPIGVAIGYVTIAAMLASFAYSQGQASAAVNKDDNAFKDGVVDLQGPGTETSDSIPAKLSKRESVVTAKGTRKAKTLLKGLNADDNFLIEKGIAELLKNTGVSLSNIPIEIKEKKQSIREAEYQLNFSSNNKGVESKLDALTEQVKKTSSQETRTVLPDGRLMVKKGLNTTYIRQKNG
jgi:hypothetical protein